MDSILAERGAGDPPPRALGLYVHVPFCASKCHFCDWVVDVPVRQLRQQVTEREPYIEAVCRQIRHYGPLLMNAGYVPQVMYWGGGTAGRLAPQEMRAIHAALDESLDLSTVTEWTIETTPNDLSEQTLLVMRRLGVTRVSIGVQSFDPLQLRTAGRAHTAQDAETALRLLREHGFCNFNVDLIVGFPGEDAEQTLASIARAISFEPTHISAYPFRATPKTVMSLQIQRGRIVKPTLKSLLAADELARGALGRAGYREYSHGYWVKDAEYEDRDAVYSYGMLGERIGFGSGADSIMCQHFLRNNKTNYVGFVRDPLHFDQIQPFSLNNPGMFVTHLGGALMTRDGLNFKRLFDLTGVSFAALRSTPPINAWLEYLRECGAEFLETEDDLQIAGPNKHRAYISQLMGIVG